MASLLRLSLKIWCPFSLPRSGNFTHHIVSGLIQPVPFIPHQIRAHSSEARPRSPYDSNIIRMLQSELLYESEYAPVHQLPAKFNFFSVEERPGEQFIRLRRNFDEKEDITIEATMFDGCDSKPKKGSDTDGEDIRLHISLIIDIFKGEGTTGLGFVCSAWSDGLEIQKVYTLWDKKLQPKAYMGPNMRKLDSEFHKVLREYLEARGVNDELSKFLHHYMTNKDRIELLRWFENVKSFVEL